MINFLFRQSEKQLLKTLPGILRQAGYPVIRSTKSYVYAEGKIPAMLIAHLDTVHKTLPNNIFHDKNLNVYWSPEGLGADDRAGVFAILQLLSYKPYILFTTGEEIGGYGAKAAARELKIPDVGMLVQLDRQGKDDAVFYRSGNSDFIRYIESFGFTEDYGSFSDISVLSPHWEILGVNLSVGYYHQHSKHEFLRMTELQDTIKKVKLILQNLPTKKFTYMECYRGHHCIYCDKIISWWYEGENPFVCKACKKAGRKENSIYDYYGEWFD